MIYTVTLNPSLDYVMKVPPLALGNVNRASEETVFPGGKGINVSIMLSHLGVENRALGFLAGFTGRKIQRCLRERGCEEEFLFLENGFSRINVKLQSEEETEINGNGPDISSADLSLLMEKLQALTAGDILVLSGSVPRSVPKTVYQDMMTALLGRGVKTVVDAADALLLDVLPCRPFLIKPNHHELSALFGEKIETRADALRYAKKLQEMGASNVLVSMAGEGAVLVAEDGKCYECDAPKGKVIHSVGAGDSMVAGFLAGYLDGEGLEKALYMGVAAGSASAFSEDLAEGKAVLSLYRALTRNAMNKDTNL